MRPERTRSRPSRSVRVCTRLLLAGTLLLPLAHAAASPDLEQVRARIAEVRAALEADTSRLTAAREAAFALDHDIAEASARHDELATRIARKEARIANLAQTRATLAAELDDARAVLRRNLAAHYALAVQPRLKLLLNQDHARDVSRQLAYHEYIARAYGDELAGIADKLARQAGAAAALRLEAERLRQLRQRAGDEVVRLQALRESRAGLAEAIVAGMADDKARLAELENDERKLVALVESLDHALDPTTQQPFAELKGALTWPVDGKVAKGPGRALRAGGARWAGVVIAARPGTEVHAVAAGEVVYADWFRNLGRLVIVDHGGGYMTLYGNARDIMTEAGARVAAGDTIATVGEGDGYDAQGLYFELRVSGRPLDPRSWCASR